MRKDVLPEKEHGSCFGNLPANLGYSIECAKETVESIAASAKVDVEAFLFARHQDD